MTLNKVKKPGWIPVKPTAAPDDSDPPRGWLPIKPSAGDAYLPVYAETTVEPWIQIAPTEFPPDTGAGDEDDFL